MNDVATIATDNLPAMIEAAASRLAQAKTSGEVLEVRNMAQAVYDAAKSAGRMQRAKRAHDDILAATYRAQGDALAIQSRAKMRLADEYDAAQERGEVAGHGRSKVEADNLTTAADLGLRRDEIFEARQLRDIEQESPGIVDDAITAVVGRGEEPSKAAVSREIDEARNVHVSNNSGNNEWYTPPKLIEAARMAMGEIDFDPASSQKANETVRAATFFTKEDDGINQRWPSGRIWMNPPYAQPLINQFCEKYSIHMMRDSSSEGVVLVNNATETAWFQNLLRISSAVCFPKGRIKFLDPDGNPSGAPLQGQAILYSGRRPDVFASAFVEFGSVMYNEL